MKDYLTLAAIVRDQEYYIAEWLHFYLGVLQYDKAVLVLHKCSDDTEGVIRSLSYGDRIKIHHVKTDAQHVQMQAYEWIANKYGNSTKWMAFVDSDEFLFPVKNDMKTTLEPFESFGAVAVHWKTFGAHWQVERPSMPSIERYISFSTLESESGPFKSIVNMEQYQNIISPHYFGTKTGTVNEQFEKIDLGSYWHNRTPSYEKLQCNHYYTRSMQDYCDRANRGSCNDTRRNSYYNVDNFFKMQYNLTDDFAIQRFVPQLKGLLK